MRALVWTGVRQMEIQEVPMPRPAPGEVLLRVDAAGICGSELSGYLGTNTLRKPPLIMGHEFSATVVESDSPGLSPGDSVVVNPLYGCGRCMTCKRGLEHICPRRTLVGVHTPGAFAEYVTAPASCCLPMPAGLDGISGALVEPLACGLRTVELAGVRPGDTVLVLGAGPIGLSALACARSAGALTTVVTDIHPGRRSTAISWGAAVALNPREQDPVAAVRELTGGLGADVAIDAVGSDETRRQAVRAVRPGGSVVLVGLHEEESPLAANYVARQEITVQGSFAYSPDTFQRALAMVAAGVVRSDPSWVEERDLSRGDESFAELVEGRSSTAKIILRP